MKKNKVKCYGKRVAKKVDQLEDSVGSGVKKMSKFYSGKKLK